MNAVVKRIRQNVGDPLNCTTSQDYPTYQSCLACTLHTVQADKKWGYTFAGLAIGISMLLKSLENKGNAVF